uniref:Ycf34 n=1 Tax=Laurencia catarinensis TaxID=197326 RepID=UPI0028D6DF13|nr:Ycf34 [Laurencia catarinensis]WMP12442.1 Ycf34 [Laurencia catarinensis]
MCICINCRHLDKCSTYQFIKKQHNKLIVSQNIPFNPISTIIDVNVNKKNTLTIIDWDLIECLSFVEKPGSWSN